MRKPIFQSNDKKIAFYNELLAPCKSQVPDDLELYRLEPTQSEEAKRVFKAPFKDKNGHELWSDNVVVNDYGQQMVLRYGPYKTFDDTYSVEGWGWYLQVGAYDEEKKTLTFYQVTPVCDKTPAFITYLQPETKQPPIWWEAYQQLARRWQAVREHYDRDAREGRMRRDKIPISIASDIDKLFDYAGRDLCRICREHAKEWDIKPEDIPCGALDPDGFCRVVLNYWLEEVIDDDDED